MLEKLLTLSADTEFVKELSQAVKKLEERNGVTVDTKELKVIINNIGKLCQTIR